MKKIYLLITAAVTINSVAKAQTPCGSGRFASDVFTNVTTTSGVAYGANITYSGSNQTLTLDFYEPTGDVATERPLIIWAHGGSFIGGTSTDVDMVSLSQHFAKKGYVCASINYRIGTTSFDSIGLIPAVIRSVQDMKAAIRFFYKDRATTNTYKIDTNNIFIGGSSAGALTALHTEYLDKTCEITPYISQANLTAMGGLNGYSGNQCYSQKVKGVIDLCGALGVYGWLETGNTPLCSMHGTSDATVPYSRGMVNPGIPIMYADGSRMLYQQAQAIGVQDNFYTWLGAPHVPYAGTTAPKLAYMDTTVNFIRDFLIGRLGCTNPPLQAPDAPFGTATLYSYTPCTINVTQNCSLASIRTVSNDLLLEIYPNPSSDKIKIVFDNANETHFVQITDISGRVIRSYSTTQADISIEKGDMNTGIYLLKVSNSKGLSTLQKLMFY